MESLIKLITKEGTNCYFLSPHFDDAVLSCGALIKHLRSKKVKVTVVNIFTKGNERSTLSAKVALKNAGFHKTTDYYEARRKEDFEALTMLDVKVVNLNFCEALWRERPAKSYTSGLIGRYIPELVKVYPTYRFHIKKGKISRHDDQIKKRIMNKLRFIKKDDFLFFPVAVGNHVDHVLTREVASVINAHKVGWEDFPYNTYERNDRKGFVIFKNVNTKLKYIKKYKTQVGNLFPNGIRVAPERYKYHE